MQVVIRADAGTQLGSGHVMRCLALAEALAKLGFAIIFLCREQPGHLAKVIEAHGHTVRLIPAHPSEAEDASETLKTISLLGRVEWVVVDNYELGQIWEARVRASGVRVLAIVDGDEKTHVPDVVVNQNLGADSSRLEELFPPYTIRLFGPRYAMLRDEFLEHDIRPSTARLKQLRILVSFGGMDHTNETTKFLDAWNLLNPDASADIVIGTAHQHKNKIAARIDKDDRLRLHVQIDNMAELMVNSDLAIGTAGSTSWERCFTGLPSITISTADNQIPIAQALAQAGASIFLGDATNTTSEQIASALNFLILNPAARSILAQQAAKIIDGQGSRRIATLMLNLTRLSVRKATSGDSETIFTWRNDPAVRRASTDSTEIPWPNHQLWLQKRLSSHDSHLLMIEQGGVPIGVTRFEIERTTSTAEVSLYLNPELLGSGLGPAAYRIAEDWFLNQETEISCLKAAIQDLNHASNRLFTEQGFKTEYRHYKKHVKEKEPWTA